MPAPGMGLAYSEFIAPLVKAVQELSAKVQGAGRGAGMSNDRASRSPRRT